MHSGSVPVFTQAKSSVHSAGWCKVIPHLSVAGELRVTVGAGGGVDNGELVLEASSLIKSCLLVLLFLPT